MRTPYTTLKIAVFTPMPRASVSIAVRGEAGILITIQKVRYGLRVLLKGGSRSVLSYGESHYSVLDYIVLRLIWRGLAQEPAWLVRFTFFTFSDAFIKPP